MASSENTNEHSDIPRDRCLGLNQSATRICGHDFTIMPTYCVVCRTRAITPPYANNKRCLGPRTTASTGL